MFLTVKTNQDKTWLKNTFISSCCLSIQSVLTSVKFHILITSLVSLKIQNHTHNWLDHVHSPSQVLTSIMVLSDPINILLSSLLVWDKTLQEFLSQRKVKNHQNSLKLQLFTDPPSNHSKLKFWNCWKTLFTMEKLNLTGDKVLILKIRTKKQELLNSVVSLKNNTKLVVMIFWKKTCHLTKRRFWKASFQSLRETSQWKLR